MPRAAGRPSKRLGTLPTDSSVASSQSGSETQKQILQSKVYAIGYSLTGNPVDAWQSMRFALEANALPPLPVRTYFGDTAARIHSLPRTSSERDLPVNLMDALGIVLRAKGREGFFDRVRSKGSYYAVGYELDLSLRGLTADSIPRPTDVVALMRTAMDELWRLTDPGFTGDKLDQHLADRLAPMRVRKKVEWAKEIAEQHSKAQASGGPDRRRRPLPYRSVMKEHDRFLKNPQRYLVRLLVEALRELEREIEEADARNTAV